MMNHCALHDESRSTTVSGIVQRGNMVKFFDYYKNEFGIHSAYT